MAVRSTGSARSEGSLAVLSLQLEFSYWYNIYLIAIFLDGVFVIIGHDGKIVTLQFACTFHNSVNLALLRLGTAQVITYLHQTFDVGSSNLRLFLQFCKPIAQKMHYFMQYGVKYCIK